MLSTLFKAYNNANKESSLTEASPFLTTSSYEDNHAVSKPIEIKYYVPKQLEVQGLSQSLVCHTDPYYQNYIHDDFELDDDTAAFPTVKEKAKIFYSSSVPNELVLFEDMNPLYSPNFKQYLSSFNRGWSSSSVSSLFQEDADDSHETRDVVVDTDCCGLSFDKETIVDASCHEEEGHVVLILDEDDVCEEVYGTIQDNSSVAAYDEGFVRDKEGGYVRVLEEKEWSFQQVVFNNQEKNTVDKNTFVSVDGGCIEEVAKEVFATNLEVVSYGQTTFDENCVYNIGKALAPYHTPDRSRVDDSYDKEMNNYPCSDSDSIQFRKDDKNEGFYYSQSSLSYDSNNEQTVVPIKEYYGVQEYRGACYYYDLSIKPSYYPALSTYYTKSSTRRVSSPPTVSTIPEVDEDYEEWCELADERYGKASTSLWNVMHESDATVEKIKTNPFIRLFLSYDTYPLKVINLPKATQYKEIQNHFFDPNVLYIRHLRHYRCAYIVYRNYQQMMKAYHFYHMSLIKQKPIHCEPSTMDDLERDYELDVKRRLACTKQIVNRKYDTFIPNYHQIDQNLECYLRYQSEGEESQAPKYDIPIAHTLHVLVKPNSVEELDFIKQWGYLPVQEDKVEYLNKIFNRTPDVLLLVSRKQGRQFQGLARMKSEAMELADLDSSSPLRGANLEFKEAAPNWRHACKIEWLSSPGAKVPMKQVGDLCNSWNDGRRIRYTSAVTLIEPGVANTIIKLMDKD